MHLRLLAFLYLLALSVTTARVKPAIADGPPIFCPDCVPFTCAVASYLEGNSPFAEVQLAETGPYRAEGIAAAQLSVHQGENSWPINLPVKELDFVKGLLLPSNFVATQPYSAEVILFNTGGGRSLSFCHTH